MAVAPYYPPAEGNQIPWHGNLQLKIANPAYASALSLGAGEVAKVQSINKLMIYVLGTWLPAIRAYAESATEVKNKIESGVPGTTIVIPDPPQWNPPVGSASLLPGLLDELFALIARWKTATGYTDQIGQDLGIVGATVTPSLLPPSLDGELTADGVAITFKKLGHIALLLQSRRMGEEAWADLAIEMHKPYIDTRELKVPNTPEWREYRARFWDGVPVGNWSDVLRITVGN